MAKKLWGGRFSKKTDPLVEEFTKSVEVDYKLAKYDIFGSKLHVKLLSLARIISLKEAKKLQTALSDIEKEIEVGKFDKTAEDIHTVIQNKLEQKVGKIALKMHTARSRNDQVVFDTKVYCVKEGAEIDKLINKVILSIETLDRRNKDIKIPGYTHMQHAQPIKFKDYILAYKYMFGRDHQRLLSALKRINFPIGSGALAGTFIESKLYDRAAKEFNKSYPHPFIKVVENQVDNISSRDFVIEILSILAILGMHLSRLTEDFIIWSTKEFGFIEIDDAFCTGSSLMPQKKNPDVLELVRGYTGKLYGNLFSVLVTMKGLPLTYNRDMQLDKDPLFNSIGIVSSELKLMAKLLDSIKLNKKNIEKQLEDEALYATDLVYYLVDKKVPFKEAHDIVGKLVKYSINDEIEIKNIPQNVLKKFSEKFVKEEVIKLFNSEVSVKSKKSIKRD